MGFFQSSLIVAGLLLQSSAQAQFANTAFYKNRAPGIRFITTAQNLPTYNCSDVVTVQTQNASGVAVNVASNLTINLSGSPGMTFYSDSSCATAITSVTVIAGQNSANFYFLDTTPGARQAAVSATGYQAGSQTQTLTASSSVWTGGGANANWSTAANWSGGVVPNSGQVAIFNSTCVSNCSPVIDTNVDVYGIRMVSGFTGTITQNSGFSMWIRTKGWYQEAGNFVGSSGTSNANNVTVQSSFHLLGGSFQSTAAILDLTYNVQKIVFSDSATFNHRSATVQFNNCSSPTIDPGNHTFNNLILVNGCNWSGSTLNGILKVAGDILVESSSYQGGFGGGGTINLSGNLYSKSSSWGISALVRLVGGIGSSVTVRGTNASIGSLEIASLGTVTFVDKVPVSGNFTYTSGTVVTGTSNVVFGGNGTLKPGGIIFNDVTISQGAYSSLTLDGTLLVNRDLYLSNWDNRNSLSGGTIEVQRNYTALNTGHWSYWTPVILKGPANRTITTSAPTASDSFGNATLTINTDPGAVVTLGSTVSMEGNGHAINLVSGTINQAGYNLSVTALTLNGNTITRTAGVLKVNGVTVGAGTQSVYGGTVQP